MGDINWDTLHDYSGECAVWLSSPVELKTRLESLKLHDPSNLYPKRIRTEQVPEWATELGVDASDSQTIKPIIELIKTVSLRSRGRPNLILLCGKCGSGKTSLLWRLFLNEQSDIPKLRLFLDFEKSTCSLEYISGLPVDRSTGKWIVGSQSNLFKGREALARQLLKATNGVECDPLIIIDGLDNAARFVATELEVEQNDTAEAALKYVMDEVNGILLDRSMRNATVVISLDLLPNNAMFADWQALFDYFRDRCTTLVLDAPSDHIDSPPNQYLQDHWDLPIYRNAFKTTSNRYSADARQKMTRSQWLEKTQDSIPEGPWVHVLVKTAVELEEFLGLLIESTKDLETTKKYYHILSREWTGIWFDLLCDRIKSDRAVREKLMELFEEIPKKRWDLSSTFALSNVVTALVESGELTQVTKDLSYCRLQRAVLKGAKIAAKLVGVDCQGAWFNSAEITGQFIAVDCRDAIFDQVQFKSKAVHSILPICDSLNRDDIDRFDNCIWEPYAREKLRTNEEDHLN